MDYGLKPCMQACKHVLSPFRSWCPSGVQYSTVLVVHDCAAFSHGQEVRHTIAGIARPAAFDRPSCTERERERATNSYDSSWLMAPQYNSNLFVICPERSKPLVTSFACLLSQEYCTSHEPQGTAELPGFLSSTTSGLRFSLYFSSSFAAAAAAATGAVHQRLFTCLQVSSHVLSFFYPSNPSNPSMVG